MDVAVAVPLALGGAFTFAASTVLQARVARQQPPELSASWRLLQELLRRPQWLLGMVGVMVGFCLQASALAFAPVAVVEPLIVTELVFALPLAARLRHSRLGRREWCGALAVVAGVGVFLGTSAPSGGNSEPQLAGWGAVTLPVLALAAAAVVCARGPETPRRATLLAAGSGFCLGVLALVSQSFVVLLGRGFGGALTSWQPYVLAGLGTVGFAIAQSAYQAAPLAVSLPIIDALEPIISVLLAAVLFGQHLSVSGVSLGLEALGALVAIAGLVSLARSPLILQVYEQQQRAKSADAPQADAPSFASGRRAL